MLEFYFLCDNLRDLSKVILKLSNYMIFHVILPADFKSAYRIGPKCLNNCFGFVSDFFIFFGNFRKKSVKFTKFDTKNLSVYKL